MKRIVAFDVSDDKIRYRLVKILLSKGIRLQESVFAIQVSARELDELYDAIQKLVGDKAVVHIFPLCSSCEEKTLAINAAYQYCVIV